MAHLVDGEAIRGCAIKLHAAEIGQSIRATASIAEQRSRCCQSARIAKCFSSVYCKRHIHNDGMRNLGKSTAANCIDNHPQDTNIFTVKSRQLPSDPHNCHVVWELFLKELSRTTVKFLYPGVERYAASSTTVKLNRAQHTTGTNGSRESNDSDLHIRQVARHRTMQRHFAT